jgi:DNA primase
LISEQDIRRVRDATDLVALVSEQVALKQRGRLLWGRCPFHEEKTPSFKVDPVAQLYHCFGCGQGGDAFGFVMRTQNLNFLESVHHLAQRAGIEIAETGLAMPQGKRAQLRDILNKSAFFYHRQLMREKTAEANAARRYLSSRQFGSDIAKQWNLGFASGGESLVTWLLAQGFKLDDIVEANLALKTGSGRSRDRFYSRVMFPISDLQGQTIAFGGRTIGQGEPKYINSSDTPLFHKRETLYALHEAKSAITSGGVAIVTEGYTDVIAMHTAGFTNTVATLGTALTIQHIRLLNRFAKRLIYLFDGDKAGQRAAVRASELITKDITPEAGKFQVELAVALLPDNRDPAELLSVQGEAAMRTVLEGAQPLLRFAIRHALAGAPLDSPERRAAALSRALAVLVPIRGSILATGYIQDELVREIGMDFADVMALFMSLPEPHTYRPAPTDLSPVTGGKALAHSNAATLAGAAGLGAGRPIRNQDSPSDKEGAAAFQGTAIQGTRSLGGVSQKGGRSESLNDMAVTESAQVSPCAGLDESLLTRYRLQADLITLYIEYPQLRERLASAFENMRWTGLNYRRLVGALLVADAGLSSSELYQTALAGAEGAGELLSAGLSGDFKGEAEDSAELALHMLAELQLQDDIAVAKIAYGRASRGELVGDGEREAKTAEELYKDIACMQAELAQLRERLAQIPKRGI